MLIGMIVGSKHGIAVFHRVYFGIISCTAKLADSAVSLFLAPCQHLVGEVGFLSFHIFVLLLLDVGLRAALGLVFANLLGVSISGDFLPKNGRVLFNWWYEAFVTLLVAVWVCSWSLRKKAVLDKILFPRRRRRGDAALAGRPKRTWEEWGSMVMEASAGTSMSPAPAPNMNQAGQQSCCRRRPNIRTASSATGPTQRQPLVLTAPATLSNRSSHRGDSSFEEYDLAALSEDCALCLAPFEASDEISFACAGHAFHEKCIRELAEFRALLGCPMCQANDAASDRQIGQTSRTSAGGTRIRTDENRKALHQRSRKRLSRDRWWSTRLLGASALLLNVCLFYLVVMAMLVVSVCIYYPGWLAVRSLFRADECREVVPGMDDDLRRMGTECEDCVFLAFGDQSIGRGAGQSSVELGTCMLVAFTMSGAQIGVCHMMIKGTEKLCRRRQDQ